MNKLIVIYIKGEIYNPMFKWNSVEEFIDAITTNTKVPNKTDIVVEAYIDDNLIDMGNTFECTLNKIKLICGID